MAGSFNTKIAVITGGTQGLGEQTARLFAERGAEGLVICGRNTERGNQVAASLSGQGCKTVFVQADLENAASAGLPFGRLLEPAEVAKSIAFLASDESGMMTGSIVNMDQSVDGCYDEPPRTAKAMTL